MSVLIWVQTVCKPFAKIISRRQKLLLHVAREELKNALRTCGKYIITWAAYVNNFMVKEFDMTVNMY